MARAVSVKIPTIKVIEMVEKKIALIKEDNITYPERLADYNKKMDSLVSKLVKIAKDNLGSEKVVAQNGYRAYSINISSELVAGIEFPNKPTEPNSYYAENQLKELEKTLKLLKLTEQESVTSSTYNSVLDLL
jgi:hypothetical protein